jgi:hypothetical protein
MPPTLDIGQTSGIGHGACGQGAGLGAGKVHPAGGQCALGKHALAGTLRLVTGGEQRGGG